MLPSLYWFLLISELVQGTPDDAIEDIELRQLLNPAKRNTKIKLGLSLCSESPSLDTQETKLLI